ALITIRFGPANQAHCQLRGQLDVSLLLHELAVQSNGLIKVPVCQFVQKAQALEASVPAECLVVRTKHIGEPRLGALGEATVCQDRGKIGPCLLISEVGAQRYSFVEYSYGLIKLALVVQRDATLHELMDSAASRF